MDVELASAQQALDEGRWPEAYAAFRSHLADRDDPRAHEGLAQCAWWQDEGATCLTERELAYRLYRDLGDNLGAARAATSLAWDAVLFGQGDGVGRGWLRRAADLLAGEPEAAEHGWHAVREAEFGHTVDHDPAASRTAADRATAIGGRLGLADLEITGRAFGGLARVAAGDLDEGMAWLDAAVAAATAGDVGDLMWMGKICCWLIAACAETQDVERAADWCRRVAEMSATHHLAPLLNVCRVQHAGLQVLQGDWVEAERQLVAAIERLADSRRTTRLAAVVTLGDLRRRQGRYDEAEALLRQAEFLPASVVGQALVCLARGDDATAWTRMRRVLAEIPTRGPLDRAAVLPAAVTVALAAGETSVAADAAHELRTIADLVGTSRLLGLAAVADAELATDPTPIWWEAVRLFSEAGLGFDEAEARLRLAESLAGEGDTGQACEQARAARALLDDLGATGRLVAARQLIARLDPGGEAHGVLSRRQVEVLSLVTEGLSNAEISRRLHLSEHTVHRHVANILTALGLGSRTAAATYATKHGLV